MKLVNQSRRKIASKVSKCLLDSIHDHLANPDFDLDEGEVRLIDSDDCTLYFGLLEIDSDTGELGAEPVIVWSVEVSSNLQQGR